MGWTQERIAKAKGIGQGTVSKRLTFHLVPDKVKEIIGKGLMDEFSLREICKIFAANNLSGWLTTG